MPKLVTWMNNQRVGELTKLANGAHILRHHFSISGPWRYGNTHQRSQTGNGA